MKRRVQTVMGIGVAVSALALGGIGTAIAQGPFGSGNGTERPDGTTHAAMMQKHANGEPANGPMAPLHQRALAAVAEALGITVEELQTQLTAGTTVATLAQQRGADLATVHAAVQGVHRNTGMPGQDRGL